MQTKVLARARCGSWVRGPTSPLLSLALCTTLANPSTAATPPVPAKATYRIIAFSPDLNACGPINAKGQVAFTEIVGEAWLARFCDGAAIRNIRNTRNIRTLTPTCASPTRPSGYGTLAAATRFWRQCAAAAPPPSAAPM